MQNCIFLAFYNLEKLYILPLNFHNSLKLQRKIDFNHSLESYAHLKTRLPRNEKIIFKIFT
jgi:hypothetical protein